MSATDKQAETNYFEQGQKQCREYYASQAFAGLTRNIKAEDAIKLFWPPVEEMQIMVSTPLPKPRQKWIAGFKKQQVEMLAEVKVVSETV